METTINYADFTLQTISTLLVEIWNEIIRQRDSVPFTLPSEEPQKASLPRTIGDIRDIYGDLLGTPGYNQIEAC